MGVIAFLRRLVGGGEDYRRVDSEFRERLAGIDEKNAELDALNSEIGEVLITVTERQSMLSLLSVPPTHNAEAEAQSVEGAEDSERPKGSD